MNRLRGRLSLAFLVVILVTLCSISVALLLILRQNPLEERQALTTLTTQATGLAALLRRSPQLVPGSPHWTNVLGDISERQELRLAWADPHGTIIFDSDGRWEGQTLEECFTNRHSGVKKRWVDEVQDDQQRWLVIGLPWPNPQAPVGDLIVARPAPTTPFLQQFRTTLLSPLLQSGLLALLLSVLLALTISRSITHPLQKVANAARALAAGNLQAHAPVSGPEEVQDLARAFNEMSRQVQTSQQAQRDLVANVAHDLRTPLTSIQGFAQALVDGTAVSPESQTQAAQAIYEESRRMRYMTDTLLDLARFEAQQVSLQLAPVELSALAQKRGEHFRLRAEAAQITLQLDTTEENLVAGDASRLEQVLDNLLENALHHTPAGGRIAVGVRQAPPWVELTVADTGRGIPQEEIPRIFERFYRGDKSRGGKNAGLGLAIVKEIVQAHGGTIQAESVVGVGSKFTVRLPCLSGPASMVTP